MASSAQRHRHIGYRRFAGLGDNLRGALAMCVAMFALTLNFGVMKLVGESIPVGETMFIRGAIAGCIAAAITARNGAFRHFRLALHPTVLLRTISESLAATVYFVALTLISIGDATIIIQAQPLFVTAAAALIFGEVVRPQRWVAIMVGFVGVMIVLRPGLEGVDLALLLMIVVVVLNVIRDLSTRAMPKTAPVSLVLVFTLTAQMAIGAGSALFVPWVAPSGYDVMAVAVCSVLVVAGMYMLIFATRTGELSVIAPFRYSSVVWAVALGYLVWSDVVDAPMAVGAVVIILSGLYISYSGRARRAAAPPSEFAAAGVREPARDDADDDRA